MLLPLSSAENASREFQRVAKKVIREYERNGRACGACCGALFRAMQKPLDVRHLFGT